MIRALNATDAAAAALIHAGSFETPWDEAVIAAYIPRDLCFGLFEGETLCAFCVITLAADQGDIITIATSPARRGQGHGAQLLSMAETAAKARGISTLFLEVAVDNAAALALYKGAGFHGVGKRPAYYKRAEGRVAALILRKDLS